MVDTDDYEEEPYRYPEMSDNHFKSMFTLDIKKSLMAYLPNILGLAVLLFYVQVLAQVMGNFQTVELQLLSLIILGYSFIKTFPRLLSYRLVWKLRDEYTTTLQGNNQVKTFK